MQSIEEEYMNDLTFINNLEDSQRVKAAQYSPPAKAKTGGEGKDSYVDGSSSSCSVHSVSTGSASSFWSMMFRLFGFD